jgi:hypothetical protein
LIHQNCMLRSEHTYLKYQIFILLSENTDLIFQNDMLLSDIINLSAVSAFMDDKVV